MRLFDKRMRFFAGFLTYSVPILLLIPNVALSILGHLQAEEFLANVFLPGGMMLLVMTLQGKTGRNTLLLIPFMILAAFQIVLLFLYGDGSIIGVDMFLNVVTTNLGEATELLSSLKVAIILVCLIYIPPIILGIIAVAKNIGLQRRTKKIAQRIGVGFCLIGAVFVFVCKMSVPNYAVNEKIFPYNVVYNLGIAAKRTVDVANYKEQSESYTYDACSTRSKGLREVYVAVIGETSRAANWELCGYDRSTNPCLSQVSDSNLVCFEFVLSESNTTHKAVPLMLSPLTVDDFDDDLNQTRSILQAFKEAGFHTVFVSNQCHNRSYIDFFAYEADEVYFMKEPDDGHTFEGEFDIDMLTPLDSVIEVGRKKQLIVLHQYGSHFNYKENYQSRDACFMPDDSSDALAANRLQLINAYDNSIRHTDRFLSEILNRLDSLDCLAGMLYASDHGEDIFDDSRKRFLHASPTPTFHQLYVPMLVYLSDSLILHSPELYLAAEKNSREPISSSRSFAPTLLQLAGISTPMIDTTNSTLSDGFCPVSERKFLSDRNEALSLEDAGFCPIDFQRLDSLRWRIENSIRE